MLIDDSGRLLGKVNIIDFGFTALLVLGALGLIAVQSGFHKTSGQMIQGEADIRYTFQLRNVKTFHPDTLFKPGDKLSMTIRNQPRGAVEIIDVKHNPKRILLGNGQLVPDTSDPNGYDFLVTVKDHATITSDGYVTEGVKVKTGMGMDVESARYRLSGVIIDIQETGTPIHHNNDPNTPQ